MQYLRSKFLQSLFISKAFLILVLGILAVSTGAFAEDDDLLIMEPVVQGISLSDLDYAYVYPENKSYYVSLAQIGAFTGLQIKKKEKQYTLFFPDSKKEYFIDLDAKLARNIDEKFSLSSTDYKMLNDELFLSSDFLKKLLDISTEIDTLEMRVKIEGKTDFPSIRKRKADIQRSKIKVKKIAEDPISNYQMDDRLFSMPTVDLSYSRFGNKADKFKSGDFYSASMSGIVGGLDVNAYLSGSTIDEHNTTKRLLAGRTFLDDNAFNLKKFYMGDINGVSSSFFNTSSSGRGVALSSFKNLVMAADKTIDIAGPILDGWEVELYWNDQLIGYRQNSENGEYNFQNIPVSYGLNKFKLIFYGPYGEVKTETRNYYSGTSPVKKGEIGYDFSALQPNRSLFRNDSDSDVSNVPIVDMNLYYGATDNTSLMIGAAQAQDPQHPEEKVIFSMLGIQSVFQGASLQYNLERNNDTNEIGHHVGIEGNIYIGDILAQYDYFDKLHSPLSYQGGQYKKEQLETRLSGILPLQVLYYFSYKRGTLEDNSKFNFFSSRLSKQIFSSFNVSLLDDYFIQNDQKTNSLQLGLHTWKDKITAEAWLRYKTHPQKELENFSCRVNWRSGRYIYYSGNYTYNFQTHSDSLNLSAGHNFQWGGLSVGFDTDHKLKNYGAKLTYTIGFGVNINNDNVFPSGATSLTDTGTIYAELYDKATNQPLEGVKVSTSGHSEKIYSDAEGHAVLTDLSTYEKTLLSVDMETIDDLSLRPERNDLKLILRPGAVNYVKIPFVHYGSLEGQIPNPGNKMMLGYEVKVLNDAGESVASSFSDTSGYFIVDNIPYGEYTCIIEKDGQRIKKIKKLKIDDSVIYIDDI